MAYVLLPNSGQSLGITRDQIKTNFTIIQNIFDTNHYTFDLVNQGKHRFVEMPVLGATPTTASGEGATYTKTINALSQLFYVRDGNAANEVQLTGPFNLSTPTVRGSMFLPGGLLLQWGVFPNAVNNAPVSFITPFSGPAYAVVATSNNNNTNIFNMIKTTLLSSTGFVFQILTGSGSPESAVQNISWFAIGPRT